MQHYAENMDLIVEHDVHDVVHQLSAVSKGAPIVRTLTSSDVSDIARNSLAINENSSSNMQDHQISELEGLPKWENAPPLPSIPVTPSDAKTETSKKLGIVSFSNILSGLKKAGTFLKVKLHLSEDLDRKSPQYLKMKQIENDFKAYKKLDDSEKAESAFAKNFKSNLRELRTIYSEQKVIDRFMLNPENRTRELTQAKNLESRTQSLFFEIENEMRVPFNGKFVADITADGVPNLAKINIPEYYADRIPEAAITGTDPTNEPPLPVVQNYTRIGNLSNLEKPNKDMGGSTVNNYAATYQGGQLSNEGKAIHCDAFHVEKHGNFTLGIVADGNGWGNE